jgi:glyoxylase-like metal-dependent hydrolase (beta-lactamase superfamily II)
MKIPIRSFERIRLGFANVYLVRGAKGCILIDAGSPNQERTFIRRLQKYGFSHRDIRLIVVTHAHFDHVGSLKAIQQICGCPVAIHEKEDPFLRHGAVIFPPGANLLGKTASYLGKRLMRSLFRFPAVQADIIISRDFSLESFGISGTIVCTAGHTEGSLSVLLSSGEAFVGDLAANYLPFGLGPVSPPFGEDLAELHASWQRLLSSGAAIICPGHGEPFSAELLARRLRGHGRAMTLLRW